jgi:general secretion pathway protein J
MRSGQRGFTLLELIVSLSILGLLMVLLFSGMRFGIRASESGNDETNRVVQIRLAQGTLRRQLRQASPIHNRSPDNKQQIIFTGASDELSFVAPLAGAVTGLYLITVRSDEYRAGNKLVMEYVPWTPGVENTAAQFEKSSVVLLESVDEARFAYLGTAYPGQPAVWMDRWESTTTLPRLVNIEVDFDDGHEDDWPTFMVAPKISVSRAASR